MLIKEESRKGKFEVLSSIGLEVRNEFYLLGDLLEGEIKIG